MVKVRHTTHIPPSQCSYTAPLRKMRVYLSQHLAHITYECPQASLSLLCAWSVHTTMSTWMCSKAQGPGQNNTTSHQSQSAQQSMQLCVPCQASTKVCMTSLSLCTKINTNMVCSLAGMKRTMAQRAKSLLTHTECHPWMVPPKECHQTRYVRVSIGNAKNN